MEPQSECKVTTKRGKNLKWLMEQSLDLKLSIIENHLSICQVMINELMEEEVISKAGERYVRQKPHNGRYSRWGFNPGSVKIGDTKLKMDIPRLYDNNQEENTPLNVYQAIKESPSPTDQLLKGVLLGLSTRDYNMVIDQLGEGFGLSKSSISRGFIDRTKEKLIEFENRNLSGYDFVAMFIDGKYLAKEQIIISLGVTQQGHKIPLGFVQSTTENSECIKDLFNNLIDRGLKYEDGMLFVIDGSKGIRKAVEDIFGSKGIIQRCRWHKRENILKYLPEKCHDEVKKKYHQALEEDDYKTAKAKLLLLKNEIAVINISASRSLEEGMEELLTLQRLGINNKFSKSFGTTNCIENLNSQLTKYIRKVKYWKNSKERYRWVAAGLIEIENHMKKIHNFEKLLDMRKAVQTALKISTKKGT